MMQEIYSYLQSDQVLSDLLKQSLPTVNKIGVGRANDTKAYPFIVFQSSPFQTEVSHSEYQIKMVIVTQSETELDAITNRLMYLLHTNFQPIKLDSLEIYYSRHMLGGSLIFHPEEQAYEQIMYFNLKK
jgi:hypothetical protein